MAHLDITKAAFAGFGVIRRNPLAPLVWGLVQTLLAVGPLLLVLPTLTELFSVAFAEAASGGEPDIAEMMRLQTQMTVIQPISWVAQLLAYGLVTGAIFRAVLSPGDKSWFYMRIGMAEVMLVAVSIVWTILFVVAMILAMIVVAVFGFAIGQASEGAGLLVGVLLGLIAAGVLIWACLRFSLAFAMSFDRKQFLLFESWKITSGHALGLFGVALISIIVSIVITWVVMGALLAVAAAAVLGGGGYEALKAGDIESFFTPERMPTLIPWGVGLGLVGVAITGYLGAIANAPWAEVYRQLVPKSDEVF